MKRRKSLFYCIISILLLLSVMIFIFCMSSQVAELSSNTSGGFIEGILKLFYPGFNALSSFKQQSIVDGLQGIVRKLAHFSIYTLLGMLSFNATYCFSEKKKFLFPISIAIGVLYSMSDEFHQLFVEGRSGEIRDVCIDSSGVILGVLLMFSITLLYNHIILKKKIKNERQS